MPVMAYSPLEQGRLLDDRALDRIVQEHSATPAQVALAWVLRNEQVIAIPKASSPAHVQQLRAASDLTLSEADLRTLDRAFAPPRRMVPLEMI
jgi:diketogulonate reductase-like aldo/keto reductase